MKLVVHKYGGTSMGSVERIKNVAKRVAKWHKAGYDVVVVPSAMSGETNRLLSLAKEITPEPSFRELDVIATTGEQVSVSLLAMALITEGINAKSYTGWQVPVVTDSAFTKARIDHISADKLLADIKQRIVPVVTGFQGVDSNGNITTLGRGGSDTSAVAIAAAIQADECLIYTDVDGVYTTDPRVEKQAKRLEKITFEEMLELASLGSKVLQIRSVEFAGKFQMKTRVLSSLTDPMTDLDIEKNSGTLITFEEKNMMEEAIVSGIAFNRDEAKLTLMNVPDTPGVAFQILGQVAKANIDVDMIIQNQSVNGTTDFSFTIHRNDFKRTMDLLEKEVKPAVKATQVVGADNVCKVSVVGIGMRSHVGVASKMFQTLAEEGINIQMISTSEIKISVLIEDKYMELAVRALHQAFDLSLS